MSWEIVVFGLGLALILAGFILGLLHIFFLGLSKIKRENEYKELVNLLNKSKDSEIIELTKKMKDSKNIELLKKVMDDKNLELLSKVVDRENKQG